MTQIIINADDFGIELAVNRAIYTLAQQKCIQATSIMVNLPCSDEAIKDAKKFTNILRGLHFNLTEGKSLSDPKDIPLLVKPDGTFKNGFLKLLILSFLHPYSFQKQVKNELDRQYQKLSKQIPVQHLDSHRHIHMIPRIYRLCKQLVNDEKIPHLRLVNESLLYTLKSQGDYSFLTDGGIIKWLVLKTLYYFNRAKSNRYFFSIIHTGRLFGKNIQNIHMPTTYDTIEICIHPALTDENDNCFHEYRTLINKQIKVSPQKK